MIFECIFTFLFLFLIYYLLKQKRQAKKLFATTSILKKHLSYRQIQIENSKAYILNFSLPSDQKQQILNSDVTTLLTLLNSGHTTSLNILLTYFQRAITIGLDLKAVAEINIEWAIKKAKECDTTRAKILISLEDPSIKAKQMESLGYLFGIPISLKEPFYCQGLPSTCGISTNLEKIAFKDGLLVELLKDQGAIPFITSNVPQALMINETVCRAYGRAENPWDRTRSPGGSSRGEAALISSRCSPLGFGSDSGGISESHVPILEYMALSQPV